MPDVRGTVASHNDPITIEKTTTDVGVIGSIMNAIAAIAFIMLPITPTSVVVFSIVMGSLWLATVPLTSGIIGYIYGLKFMGTLYGIVFLSHQIGSFVGVWLGGLFYDIYGSYDLVWWVGIGVGAFSAIIHLPVKEKPLHERRLIIT